MPLLESPSSAWARPPLPRFVNPYHEWDITNDPLVTDSGGTATVFNDVMLNVNMTNTGTINYPAATLAGWNYANKSTTSTHRMDAAIGTISTPFAIQVVCAIPTNGVAFDTGSGNVISLYEFSGTLYMDGGSGGSSACTVGADSGAWHVYYCEFNGSSSRLFRDMTLAATGSPGANASIAGLRLFNNRTPNSTAQPTIAFCRFIKGVETHQTIVAHQKALARKFRLPA